MRVKCYKEDCFSNSCGTVCTLLAFPIPDPNCPFYKTREEVEKGRAEAHKRLAEIGRIDLIDTYEKNPGRNW